MPAHITTPDDIQLHEWAGTDQCVRCKRPLRAEPHDAEMHQSCRMPRTDDQAGAGATMPPGSE